MNGQLISIMILLPFLGAIGQVFFGPGRKKEKKKSVTPGWLAFGTSFLSSLCGIALVVSIRNRYVELGSAASVPWLGSYSISYEVSVDGLNAAPLLLVAIVFPILIVLEWRRESGVRGLHGLLLCLQSALMGALCSQDLFLLFFFLSMTSLPFYFLISIWGDDSREKAAFRYLMTSSFGNALLFAAMIIVYYSVSPHTFSLRELLGGPIERSHLSTIAFVLMSLGFCFRLPIWPLHGWFSYVITQAPASVAVALCGVFVPSAVYLFMRLSYSLFPGAVSSLSGLLLILGAVNVVFGAFFAASQKDLRRFYASICITEVGVLLMGISSLESAGVVGSVFQLWATGLGLSGFGILCGLLTEKTGQSVFLKSDGGTPFGGLISYAPFVSLVAAILIISILGVPGVAGFIGQSLIMMGGAGVHLAVLVVIAFGVLLLTYSLFSVYRCIFLGKPGSVSSAAAEFSLREKGLFVPIVGILILVGILPKPLLELVKPSVLTLLSIVQ